MARVKVLLGEILDTPNGNDISSWEIDIFNDILVAKGYECLGGINYLGGQDNPHISNERGAPGSIYAQNNLSIHQKRTTNDDDWWEIKFYPQHKVSSRVRIPPYSNYNVCGDELVIVPDGVLLAEEGTIICVRE